MLKLKNPVALWLFCGCLLIFLMVIVGGITRLTGSGLSITEWKLIRGIIPPLNEQQWQEEFENYRKIPQFQKLNYHFTLQEFKGIYWWEYIHRLLGRIIGLVFIIPFSIFWLKRKIPSELLPKLLLLFALGAFQGFLGWYMVKSGLTENIRVSHLRLAIHLGMAFLTFGYALWLLLGLNPQRWIQPNGQRPMALIILFIISIQIIYGAFVAGTKAGHIYNTFPKMGDEWIASSVVYAWQKHGFSALINDLSVVQFIHRMLAWLLLFFIAGYWLYVRAFHALFTRHSKAALNFLMIMVILQFLLGMLTLLHGVPLWLGVLHQAGAFFLFAGSVFYLKTVS
jgi:cytochrome c oxidase assembly protein subunit 15